MSAHLRHSVLIVSDDPQVLDGLRDLMEKDGHQILIAGNGQEALELVQLAAPCIVLSDVMMPGMDGFALCRRLKEDPETARIPVVLVSVGVGREGVEQCIRAGAVDYIEKPADSAEVRLRVRTQIDLHEALRQKEILEKQLAVISSAAKDAIVIMDAEGCIVHWNEAAESLLGYPRGEALGSDLHDLFVPKRFHAMHHAALPAFKETGLGDAIGKTLELAAIRKSGEELPIELSLSSTQIDGEWCAVGILRDITERKKAEQALRETKELLEGVFDATADPMMVIGPDYRVILANRKQRSILGRDPVRAEMFCYQVNHRRDSPCDLPNDPCPLQAARESKGRVTVRHRHFAKDGKELDIEVTVVAVCDDEGEILRFIETSHDMTDLHQSEQLLKSIINNTGTVVYVKDVAGKYLLINERYEELFHITNAQIIGKRDHDIFPAEAADAMRANDLRIIESGEVLEIEEQVPHEEGLHLYISVKFPIRGVAGNIIAVAGISTDITQHKAMETELGHARKLEAVGQLAAGIAHEINTPAQFVGDSVHFLKEASEDQQALIAKYQEALEVLGRVGGHEALLEEIHDAEDEADLEYLEQHVPSAFERSFDGLSRIATIVGAMKQFAHPDQREQSASDLNEALQATLIIAKNEYKYVADVETDLGELPPVVCHVGDLNQVFLNLIVNAAHAIGDVVGDSGERGAIRVRTVQDGEGVRVEIEDTGSGVPEAIRDRIFDPFFTTKEVGKGSGQGLAIARSVVVEKHNGSLTCESEEGKGTTFVIRVPINGKGSEVAGVSS